MIPNQLNNQRFLLTNEKIPIQDKWQSLNNYNIDDPILNHHLENQPTYGVLCGYNNLIVIDFDNQTAQDCLYNKLPETFTVKTAGKGLYHAYFFTNDTATIRISEPSEKGKRGKSLLDIQGDGAMVIGPNSILKNKKVYTPINDLQIATIQKKDLLDLLYKTFKDNNILFSETILEPKKTLKSDLELFQSPEVLKIKQSFKPMQLLEKLKIPIHKNPTECPFHESESKKCLHITDDLWHCFHCGRGGDVISLYQEVYNLSFKQSVEQLFRELFLDEQKYDDAQKSISETIYERKRPSLTLNDIYNITHLMIKQYNFVTVEETNEIYYYDDNIGIFKPRGDYIIASDMEKYYKNLTRTTTVNEVINKVKRLTHKPLETFDSHKNLICVKNGVFNFDTKMLIPHNSEYYFLNYIPVYYNVEAKCPKIMKFLSEIVTCEDYEVLLEIFGFVLMKDYSIQKALLLVGSGANGKSVYLHLLKNMIGNENISAETLHNLVNTSFSACHLHGKLANISADINATIISESGLFKDLTSGKDTISAEFKFQNKFKFVNYAKLIFSCNDVPKSRDITNGYMRRWRIVKFPYTFEGVNDNKNLQNELITDEELSGLFNIAVEKYYLLRKSGCFSYEPTIDEIREEYINLSDPIQVFIDKFLVQDAVGRIFKNDLYDRIREFYELNNIPVQSTNMITKDLRCKNIRLKVVRVRVGDIYTTREAVEGFCWKEDESKDLIEFNN